MAEALGVKYRPKTFNEVCAQQSVVKILQRQLETGTIKNAMLFAGASGCGKAQPLTSNVFTPTGYKLMRDIRVGDEVVSGRGQRTKVLGVYPQGMRSIYEIKFSDRSSIRVADNHLNTVYTRVGTDKHREMTFTTLELIDYFKQHRNTKRICVDIPTIDCWEDQDLPVDPYLLGCLLGDGSLHDNFGFSNVEEDIVAKVEKKLNVWGLTLKHVVGSDYGITWLHPATGSKYLCSYKDLVDVTPEVLREALLNDGYEVSGDTIVAWARGIDTPKINHKYPELKDKVMIRISDNYHTWNESSNTLLEALRNLGVCVKSVDKHIPKAYLYSSLNTRLELLRGLMDTRGEKGGRDFSTSSEQLAEDFDILTRSLGIQVTKQHRTNITYRYRHKNIDEIRNAHDSWGFYLHPSNEMKIYTSKKITETATPVQNPPSRKIVDIQYVGEELCQCIYVEAECHTYLTDNLTVTHNTTLGRIVANEINNHLGSPIEIDAASNGGVENVKQIIRGAQERSVDSKYKVYIIDECHAISTAGWQAFLKCIEEPPQYTIFIFCTTDPQKIPETIKNRVQRFTINRIPTNIIRDRLAYVCRQEGFTNFEESIDYISKLADGGMRAALAYLDKASGYSTDLGINNVLAALGNYSYDTFFDLINYMIDGNEGPVLELVTDFYNEGNDLKLFIDQLLEFVMDVNKYAIFKSCELTKIPVSMENRLQASTNFDNAPKYFGYVADKLLALKNMLRGDDSPRTTIEIMLLRITRCS